MVIDMSSIPETKKRDLEFYDNFAANSMQACGDVITALNLSGDAALPTDYPGKWRGRHTGAGPIRLDHSGLVRHERYYLDDDLLCGREGDLMSRGV